MVAWVDSPEGCFRPRSALVANCLLPQLPAVRMKSGWWWGTQWFVSRLPGSYRLTRWLQAVPLSSQVFALTQVGVGSGLVVVRLEPAEQQRLYWFCLRDED